MHRSNSLNRSLDQCSVNVSACASAVLSSSVKRSFSTVAADALPVYFDDVEKKPSRFRSDHAVHLIPLVLILCGLVLWLTGTASQGAVPLEEVHNILASRQSIESFAGRADNDVGEHEMTRVLNSTQHSPKNEDEGETKD